MILREHAPERKSEIVPPNILLCSTVVYVGESYTIFFFAGLFTGSDHLASNDTLL